MHKKWLIQPEFIKFVNSFLILTAQKTYSQEIEK